MENTRFTSLKLLYNVAFVFMERINVHIARTEKSISVEIENIIVNIKMLDMKSAVRIKKDKLLFDKLSPFVIYN